MKKIPIWFKFGIPRLLSIIQTGSSEFFLIMSPQYVVIINFINAVFQRKTSQRFQASLKPCSIRAVSQAYFNCRSSTCKQVWWRDIHQSVKSARTWDSECCWRCICIHETRYCRFIRCKYRINWLIGVYSIHSIVWILWSKGHESWNVLRWYCSHYWIRALCWHGSRTDLTCRSSIKRRFS